MLGRVSTAKGWQAGKARAQQIMDSSTLTQISLSRAKGKNDGDLVMAANFWMKNRTTILLQFS